MAYSITPTFALEIGGVAKSVTVVKMTTDEQLFGSTYTLDIDNSADTWDAVSWVGKTFELTITPPAGGQTLPKSWVWSQNWISYEGKKIFRIVAADPWAFLAKCVPTLQVQYWNNAGMKDTSGTVKARYTDYYNKDINYIVKELTLATIGITTTWAAATGIKPSIEVRNALVGIRDLLEMCGGFLLWNGTNFVYTTPSLVAADHSYTASDSVFISVDQDSLVVPNRIYVQAVDLTLKDAGLVDPVVYSGTDNNAASYAALGNKYIDRYYQDYSGTLTSNALCTTVATAILEKIEAAATRGTVHCLNQQDISLLDCVECTDARGRAIGKGTVYSIKRTYDRGEYALTIEMGGVAGASIPDGDVPPSDIIIPSPAPSSIQEFNFQPAYLPLSIDITFTAEDDDEVSWAVGKIYTADGSYWDVLASVANQTLANDNLYYIYYDTNLASGDGNYQKLIWTQTFSNTTPHGKLLIAFAKKAANTSTDAMIVTAEGGSHSVYSYVTKLSAIAADFGLVTAGEIRVGTGTYTNFTGFRFWVESSAGRIAGISAGNLGTGTGLQWYSDTSGILWCGGGAVKMSASGVQMLGSSNLMFYYTNMTNLVGQIDGIDDAMHILGSPDILISCSGTGGVSINSGGNATTPTADDIILDSDEDLMLHADGGVDITANETLGNPPTGDINLKSSDDVYIYTGGAAGNYVYIEALMETYDLEPQEAIVDIGDASDYDEIHGCDVYASVAFHDIFDDLALIRQMKPLDGEPNKVDPTTIPDILKTSPADYLAKRNAKVDKAESRLRIRLSNELELISSKKYKLNNKIEKYKANKTKEHKEKEANNKMIVKFNGAIDKLNARKLKVEIKLSNIGNDRPKLETRWLARNKYITENSLPLGATNSLVLGAIRQIADRLDSIETRLDKL